MHTIPFYTRFIRWFKGLFPRKPKSQKFHIPFKPMAESKAEYVSPTKAYADERQKAPWNRKRKPSKAMRNVYQLRSR